MMMTKMVFETLVQYGHLTWLIEKITSNSVATKAQKPISNVIFIVYYSNM